MGMEYEAQTQRVSNVKWLKKQSSKKPKDAFSAPLIAMLASIGRKLNVFSRIKTIADLKHIIWEIMQLQNGISELRKNINLILQNVANPTSYKVILNALRL